MENSEQQTWICSRAQLDALHRVFMPSTLTQHACYCGVGSQKDMERTALTNSRSGGCEPFRNAKRDQERKRRCKLSATNQKIPSPCCGVDEPRGLTTTWTSTVQAVVLKRSRKPMERVGRRGIATSSVESCSRRS